MAARIERQPGDAPASTADRRLRMHRTRIRSVTALATLAILTSTAFVPAARAHVELSATLDVAQEVPPVDSPSTATGNATLTLEEDGTLTGEVTYQNLTGAPFAAHIHVAPAGMAGNIVFPLTLPSPAGTSGTVTVATPPFSEEQQQALFGGGMYLNFHTLLNPNGELRGQITVQPGQCDCTTLASADFKKCVRNAIKGLGQDGKKDAGIKALRKTFAKASCGRTKGPKKAIACCLPFNPVENIVTDKLCGVVPEKKCSKIGGTSLGAGSTCFTTSPCGSPSGAFLE
jgi:hypothetical protein